MTQYKKGRRNFIKNAGMVAAGLSTASSSIFNLKNLGSIAGFNSGPKEDYKALVCIYLDGGCDSFNLLVPRGSSEYSEYAATRSNLAISQSDLLGINPLNVGGIEYGLHPMMHNLQAMFNQGNACFISNMGTMIHPIVKEDFHNGIGKYPLGLFSHSDQANQWQTASPGERLAKGWAGRLADLKYDVNTNQNFSMNISFAGSNVFQSGNNQIEFTVNNSGAETLRGYGEMYDYKVERSKAIDQLLSHGYNDPFKDTYRKTFRSAIDNALEFNYILDNGGNIATEFTDSDYGGNFKMIARIMKSRMQLGFNRQIFFINYGGWDTHDNLIDDQNGLFSDLDQYLKSFNEAIAELGLQDNVITFTMSEFGRTLTSNGNGTDHAWGGNMFAIGGPIKGNRIYGNFPSLVLESENDLGNGVLLPSTANDLYFAELAMWFGVSYSDLHLLFPNLHNFYSVGSSHQPIGFINI